MATYKIYALGASNITVSGGASLSGYTQGSGAQLAGKTITLNSSNWVGINIKDNEQYFADGDNSQALDGAQSFDGTTYASGRMVEAEYRVTVQAPDGQTYELVGFNIKEPNSAYQAYGTIEGLAFIGKFPPVGVPLKVIATAEGPGASSTLSSSYAVPCFVAGTMVDTCDGPRAVESLAAGDRVWTLDDGFQPLRQILITRVDAFRMQSDKRLWPVQIRAGAFGPDCPSRDVMVSPQHKILIDDWRASYFWGDDQVLVPSVAMVDGVRVRQVPQTEDLTYVHLVFARHQVVSTCGLLSESFFPGAQALAALSSDARAEFDALFPDFVPLGPADLARPTVRRKEALVAAGLAA